MACLSAQTRPADKVVILDSGSEDTSYLDLYRLTPNVHVMTDAKDIGFCRGNNVGMQHILPDSRYVLFLNPDAFLTPNFIQDAIRIMDSPENERVGCLTGPLHGYDIDNDKPTDKVDSTGIFRNWYGRWYDRGQGQAISSDYDHDEYIPAICGALMFCRKAALDNVLLRGTEVWDSTFYMYKDDIELSLRLRQKGWKLLYTPRLLAYHCRGWNRDRRAMPHQYRLMSARNELRIHAQQRSPYIFYSLLKYCSVRTLNI